MSFHEYVILSSAHTSFHDVLLKVSSNKPAAFFVGAVVFLTWRLLKSLLFNVKAPYAGYESSWTPAWLISRRCSREAPQLIDEGYKRVSKLTVLWGLQTHHLRLHHSGARWLTWDSGA